MSHGNSLNNYGANDIPFTEHLLCAGTTSGLGRSMQPVQRADVSNPYRNCSVLTADTEH